MPARTRRITFGEDRLTRALIAYCKRAGKPLPDSGVDGMTVRNDAAHPVVLHFAKAGSSVGTKDRAFTSLEVAAALVLNCRDSGIDLPRDWAKSLEADADDTAMTLVLEPLAG